MKGSVQLASIHGTQSWFQVLQTSKQTQTAMMILEPGRSSGEEAEAHAQSDQVLLLLEGELEAQIGGEQHAFKQGDVVLIPAGVPHQFTNPGRARAVTFNTYSPPEY